MGETCKGLHTKVQMLMKKEGGDGKEGDYGKDDGKKDDGKKDDGNKGPPPKKDDQKGDYGNGAQKGDYSKGYGSDKKGGKPGSGRKLHQHGAHPPKEEQKNGEKKAEKAGEKKPGSGKEDEENAPSAELKAAMEACKKNELCRALMECKMKHKESGGKGHDDKEVCVKEMAACAADETCKGLHMKVQ